MSDHKQITFGDEVSYLARIRDLEAQLRGLENLLTRANDRSREQDMLIEQIRDRDQKRDERVKRALAEAGLTITVVP